MAISETKWFANPTFVSFRNSKFSKISNFQIQFKFTFLQFFYFQLKFKFKFKFNTFFLTDILTENEKLRSQLWHINDGLKLP